MKHKIILLTFLITTIVGWHAVQYFSVTQAKDYDFNKPGICLGESVVRYHKSLNDLFNSKVDFLTSGKPDTFINTLPPVDPKTNQRQACTANNVTTFCVAREALERYEAFLYEIKLHQEQLGSGISAYQGQGNTVTAELLAVNKRQQFIKQEIEYAKQSLDLALATYHEFRMAYPLHEKLTETVSELERYRDQVNYLRREAQLYKFKFIDVTTTQCT